MTVASAADTSSAPTSLRCTVRLSEQSHRNRRVHVGQVAELHCSLPSGTLDLPALSSSDAAALSVLIVEDGTLTVASSDDPSRLTRHTTGSAVYLVGERAYSLAWDEGTTVLALDCPEEIVKSVGVRIPRDDNRLEAPATLPVADAFFTALLDTDVSTNPIVEYTMRQLASEMVGALFLEMLGVNHEESGSDEALFQQAKTLITAQRSDPTLTASSLASALRVGPRRLQAVFRAHSTTVRRELSAARVRLAIDLLTDDQYASLSIEDVAVYSGFSDTETLRKAMAAQGLASPSTIRTRAHPRR